MQAEQDGTLTDAMMKAIDEEIEKIDSIPNYLLDWEDARNTLKIDRTAQATPTNCL